MKFIVVLSGGLDSTVSLAVAATKGAVALALTFDYGQRAARNEIRASRAISRHYGVRHIAVKLPWLAGITATALVDRSRALPRLKTDELNRRRSTEASARAVWVPNRNGIFINIAAGFAESLGADTIVTGFNREEAATFPDNSLPFVRAINRSLSYSTLNHVRIVSYVARLGKRLIVRLGQRLRAPLHLTWSCYESGVVPCGRCESCLRRQRAEEK